MSSDLPGEPYADEPDNADDGERVPLTPDEREDIVVDLEDLEVYRTLLEPTGIKGIVIDCPDCETMHHIGWALMQSNLRQLLDEGITGLHEPPYDPDPAEYVTWEYARGYADGVVAAESAID
ncbi:MAG: DUF5319 domain-containing protein [Actinomycetota bacterium]|nr:DUF5319 domain-containing protein [Actinomycetota bacterium]